MDSPVPRHSHQDAANPSRPTRLWRDTPAARSWFKTFGQTWGGKDGLIAQAARQGKGQ